MKYTVSFVLLLLLWGCKKNTDPANTNPPDPSPVTSIPPDQPVETRVAASLTDEQGRVINALHALHIADSNYTLNGSTLLTPTGTTDAYVNRTWIEVNSWNYFAVTKTTTATPSLVNYIRYKALAPNAAADFNNTAGSNVVLTDRLQVTFPPRSLYQVTTGPFPEAVKLSAYVYDMAQAGTAVKMPAYYAGDADGKRYFLKSYGAALIKATTGFNTLYTVDLLPTIAAKLKMAIPPAMLADAPDSLMVWSFGKNRLWQPSGASVKKKNNYYEGDLYALGYFMLAAPQKGAYVNLHLQSAGGSSVVNSTIRIKAGQQEVFEGQTDTEGRLLAFVPVAQPLTLEVIAGGLYGTVWTKTIGPVERAADLQVVMEAPVKALLTVKGTATACTGQPIARGMVIATTVYGATTYLPVKDGHYRASLFADDGNNIVRLRVLNAADGTEGSDTALIVSNDREYNANLTTCAPSKRLYASYSVDGNSKAFESEAYSAPGLSLVGFSVGPSTTISCASGENNFQFSTNATTAGTFTGSGVSSLNVNGKFYSTDYNKPMKVVFTRYDLITGGYIEGSIDVYYLDNSGGSHHLVANFKVKRIG